MSDATVTVGTKSGSDKARLIAGWVLTVLPIFALVLSAVMKLTRNAAAVEGLGGKYGYPLSVLVPLGVVELLCAIAYAVPATSVLGAVLVTGYLGGAVATHLRVGEAFLPPLILGVFAWAGLWLRDPRLRALLPLKR